MARPTALGPLVQPEEIVSDAILYWRNSSQSSTSSEGIQADPNATGPLMIALQGPQGSGKSSVSKKVSERLREQAGLRCEVISLDDFYLTRQELDRLVQTTANPLLKGRGPPGTHDVSLMWRTLSQLQQQQNTDVFRYDKSAFQGRGDRCSTSRLVNGASVDVIIFEGWCVGFRSLPFDQVDRVWHLIMDQAITSRLDLRCDHIREINSLLEDYKPTWSLFDCVVHLVPEGLSEGTLRREESYGVVYAWRQEQEDKESQGMCADDVRAFVDRYIPCYLCFSESLGPNTTQRRLRIFIDPERRVKRHELS